MFTIISAFFVFCLLTTAVRAQDLAPLHIAVAGPMSGKSAHLGQAMADAVKMRVDEANAAGGVNGRPVSVLVFDDENSPEKAEAIAQEIGTDPRVLTVIGHRTSGASIAAGPIYLDHRLPAISGTATADQLTPINPYYFRSTYNNGLQADFIANYMNSVMGYRSATLVSSDSVYASSLSRAFVEAASKLPLEITHQFTVIGNSPELDLDMADIVAELSSLPDSGIVFLALNAQEAAHFVREMRNSGFVLPVFGPDSINQEFPSYFEEDAILKLRPGDYSDQVYATTSMIWDVANEKAVRFRSDFRGLFGRSPDSGNALYYDTASVVLEAMGAADLKGDDVKANREAIRSALMKINTPLKSVDGITGKIYFNNAGDAVKTVPVGIFELGEFVSAPEQLEPVLNPTIVPQFSDKLEAGDIIPFASGYMHKTQIVYFGIDINEISNLNTSTGNYNLDFFVWLRFRGDLDLAKIQFSNAASPITLENPIWKRERKGMTIATYKVRHRFHGDFQFKDYPFDKQSIVLEVRHRDRLSESLKFVTDRLGMRLAGEDATLLQRINEEGVFRSAKGWDVTDARIFQDLVKTTSTLGETRSFQGETQVNFSRMKLELEIARKLTSYSTTIMLPMLILFCIGLLLFAIPIIEIPPRLSGGILVLVTVSLLRARLSNDLPNIGYLVAIDYLFFALQIIMWFGIAVSVLAFWTLKHGRPKLASRINWAGAITYPMPIIGVVIFIWMTTSAFG